MRPNAQKFRFLTHFLQTGPRLLATQNGPKAGVFARHANMERIQDVSVNAM